MPSLVQPLDKGQDYANRNDRSRKNGSQHGAAPGSGIFDTGAGNGRYFPHTGGDIPANRLILGIYPEEKISLTFQAKNPETGSASGR